MRFIPVYTGNTRLSGASYGAFAVYPCVYREHIAIINATAPSIGLSLCIQGTRGGKGGVGKSLRFIPVYTGNTVVSNSATLLFAVYPCVYREHSHYIYINLYYFGLSLCIQGTLIFSISDRACSRFIPVYTGNTQLIYF